MKRLLQLTCFALAGSLIGCAVHDGHEDEPAPIWWPTFLYRPTTHPTTEEYDMTRAVDPAGVNPAGVDPAGVDSAGVDGSAVALANESNGDLHGDPSHTVSVLPPGSLASTGYLGR